MCFRSAPLICLTNLFLIAIFQKILRHRLGHSTKWQGQDWTWDLPGSEAQVFSLPQLPLSLSSRWFTLECKLAPAQVPTVLILPDYPHSIPETSFPRSPPPLHQQNSLSVQPQVSPGLGRCGKKGLTTKARWLWTLVRDQQTSSIKDKIINILDSPRYTVSTTFTRLCYHSTKAVIDNMKTNAHSCAPIKLYWQKESQGGKPDLAPTM